MLCRWTRGFARPARSLPHLFPYLQRVLATENLPAPYV
jgi:glutathione S-transferase